jgi:type II secretory ATPase GspE/PulE/Tfp pilus assembly ATPase PilB-like protein
LIAPTLILGVAQRLVRRIAEGAAVPIESSASIKKMIDEQFADLPDEYRSKLDLTGNLYGVKPTKDAPSGMKGRIAILEMFKVDKELENIILTDPTEQKLYASVRKKGMITLKEAGILKGLEGLVSFSEINEL